MKNRLLKCAANRLAGLTGWRRYVAAAVFGGLATFALPPAFMVPVLLIAFPALLWLLQAATTRKAAFAIGWWFGFGHHLLGLYWISFALFTDIAQFWWALPLSVVGLPVLLSVFTGLTTLALWMTPVRGLSRVILFAVFWSVFEWLRGHIFTGFPWNVIGYAWVGWLPILQVASVIGVYGLGLLTVLVASVPVALGDGVSAPRRVWVALGLGFLLFAGFAGWGAARLANASGDTVPGVRLRLVQSGVEQRYKWEPEERLRIFKQHIDLSAAPASEPVTHLIWPETAIPFFIENDAANRMVIGAVTPPGGLTLTGAPRKMYEADGGVRYFNSLLAIDGSGAVRTSFDKAHLVPFGEYMPLRHYLPVGAIAGNGAEFSAGPGPRTLHLGGLPPFSPLICYEVIFPAAVLDPQDRPQWLLNLTNDAWYGRTAGPHQHFAISRTRAVEEGMPLVRSAQTGISGVVDSYGRVTAELGLGIEGILDAALPKALVDGTVYGWAGDMIFAVMLLGGVGFSFATRNKR